jgi:hypothetical protein
VLGNCILDRTVNFVEECYGLIRSRIYEFNGWVRYEQAILQNFCQKHQAFGDAVQNDRLR